MQHEKSATRKKINMKRVQDGNKCNTEKLQPKKSVAIKKVQHERSATCKENNTENYNIEKSATWK